MTGAVYQPPRSGGRLKVVVTTGAGDSFAGGYLAARLAGQPPESAGRYGNKLASIVVTYPGAIIPLAAMPVFFFG